MLRSLPPHASERVPLRVRHPAAIAAAAVLAIAAVAGVVVLALTRTHGGTAAAGRPPAARATQVTVALSQNAASQYNPFGTSARGPAQRRARDRRQSGHRLADLDLRRRRARQVGRRPVRRRARPASPPTAPSCRPPTPGFDVQVWGADRVVPYRLHAAAATRDQPRDARLDAARAARATVRRQQAIALAPRARRRRYYLLWITSLGPGPDAAPRRPCRSPSSRSSASARAQSAVARARARGASSAIAQSPRRAPGRGCRRPPRASRRRSSR